MKVCTVGHFPADSVHAHYSILHMVTLRVPHFSAFIMELHMLSLLYAIILHIHILELVSTLFGTSISTSSNFKM